MRLLRKGPEDKSPLVMMDESSIISEMMSQTSSSSSSSGSFNRRGGFLNELGMSQLHHYVGPDSVPELQAVHRDAYPTAIFYLTTILGLYLLGLVVILIHYMNSSYGQWAWTIHDVWDELRPNFLRGQSNQEKSNSAEAAAEADKKANVICDDEEECHLHQNKAKKVSNHCQKKSLAERLGARLKGSNDGEAKNNEASKDQDHTNEDVGHNNSSMANSVSQRNNTVSSMCVYSQGNVSAGGYNKGPNIEVVAVDVVNPEHV